MNTFSLTYIKEKWQHAGFQKYLKNTGWMFAGRIITLIVSFFVSAYVARYLGPSNYGLLSYAISFAALFSFIANFGIDQVIYRDLVTHPEDHNSILGTAFFIKLIGGSVAVIATMCFAIASNTDLTTLFIILIISCSYLFNPFGVIAFQFHAKVTAKYPSIVGLINTILLALIKILLIVLHKGIIYFSFIYFLEYVIYAILYIWIYKMAGFQISKWKFETRLFKTLFLSSLPLAFSAVFVSIYSRIDQVMIKHYMDAHSVGLYDAAVRVAEAWYFIPGLIIASLSPALIHSKKTSDESYDKRLGHLTLFILAISLGVAIAISFLSTFIINLLFGAAFVGASTVLKIYTWAGVGTSLGMVSTQYLITEDNKTALFFSSFIGMVANVLLNIFLIPAYGINGAAFATLISYLLVPLSTLLFKDVRKHVYRAIRAFR